MCHDLVQKSTMKDNEGEVMKEEEVHSYLEGYLRAKKLA